MFANLKKLVNPGLDYNVDDNDGANSQIIDTLKSDDGVAGAGIKGVSKLRARNTTNLTEKDSRYQSKKVKRSDLQTEEFSKKPDDDESYDPSLEKYFLLEDSESSGNDGSINDDKPVERKKQNSTKTVKNQKGISQKSNEGLDESEVECSEDEANNQDFSFVDDGDYSKYADDSDEIISESDNEDDESDSDVENISMSTQLQKRKLRRDNYSSNEDESEIEEESDSESPKAIDVKKISEEESKAKSVMSQYDLYDRIFEGRIQMQKVVTKSHHLMQPDAYPQIVDKGNEELCENLHSALESSKKLVQSLFKLHEAVMTLTPESKNVLQNTTDTKEDDFDESRLERHIPEEEDDEITSSEDESDDENSKNIKKITNVGREESTKRKREVTKFSLDDFEETLNKRHCSMKIYRRKIIGFWEERTKLLQNKTVTHKKNSGGNYTAFEESFDIVLQRLLADKDKLLKRTQLRSVNRGNLVKPIGGILEQHKVEIDHVLDIPLTTTSNTATERYDAEIYDDTDFYSKYLEDLIKTQIKRGSNKMSEAQFINFTQTLNKKNKKVVDTRRSKGRKLKYDVRSQLVGFVTPHPFTDQLDEEAVDKIITSLFGGQNTAKK